MASNEMARSKGGGSEGRTACVIVPGLGATAIKGYINPGLFCSDDISLLLVIHAKRNVDQCKFGGTIQTMKAVVQSSFHLSLHLNLYRSVFGLGNPNIYNANVIAPLHPVLLTFPARSAS